MANKAEAIAKKILREAHPQRPQPGRESKMAPRPQSDRNSYQGSGKLNSKVAIITGGDSGIGHAVAVLYAKEGADTVIAYLNQQKWHLATFFWQVMIPLIWRDRCCTPTVARW